MNESPGPAAVGAPAGDELGAGNPNHLLESVVVEESGPLAVKVDKIDCMAGPEGDASATASAERPGEKGFIAARGVGIAEMGVGKALVEALGVFAAAVTSAPPIGELWLTLPAEEHDGGSVDA